MRLTSLDHEALGRIRPCALHMFGGVPMRWPFWSGTLGFGFAKQYDLVPAVGCNEGIGAKTLVLTIAADPIRHF